MYIRSSLDHAFKEHPPQTSHFWTKLLFEAHIQKTIHHQEAVVDKVLKHKANIEVSRPTCRQTDFVDEASYQSFPSAQLSPERCKDMKLVCNWNCMFFLALLVTIGDYFSTLRSSVAKSSFIWRYKNKLLCVCLICHDKDRKM